MNAKRGRRLAVATSLLVAVVAVAQPLWEPSPARAGTPIETTSLRSWDLQSAARVHAGGADISRPDYSTDKWYPVTVPSTVLAGLVQNGAYPRLYYGTNLRDVPESEFAVPWWYRTEFVLPRDAAEAFHELNFDGINYRAEIWLNGTRIATKTDVVGTFRTYRFDVTGLVHAGANALAVEVFPVDPRKDLTITWIDWNPMPPDHEMGLWQGVSLSTAGPVTIADPQVTSQLALPSLDHADLTVTATAHNASDAAVSVEVSGRIGGVNFDSTVDIAAGETKQVTFDPQNFPQLGIDHPRVWWPYQMGSPELYSLALTASVGGSVSDTSATRFGIRDVSSKLTQRGNRVFLVNGQRILIRGGGWASDLMLREQPARTLDELRYVRDLGLNTIRLEGKLQPDRFYRETDRLGLLVMPGWMCCDRWQRTGAWTAEDRTVAQESMLDEAVVMRNHPSVFTFMVGSDTVPPPDVVGLYMDALEQASWPNPTLASASGDATPALGPTGVKMTGPYDWIPPSYWYSPRARGGADGFNTETSAGASLPEIENLARMMAPGKLGAMWRDPSTGLYHAGTKRGQFHTFELFDAAMRARLGKPTSLADYVEKAQLMNYESERAMFEAFSRNRYGSTGIIQWMMQNAWPSLHWNLFDWYLSPNGSYFGAKKANEPLHVQLSYDDHSVQVVNGTTRPATGLNVSARVFDLNGVQAWGRSMLLSVDPDQVQRAFTVPLSRLHGLSPTYFVELLLRDDRERVVSRNVYWLSTSPERIAWAHYHWYDNPTRRYADMTALSDLPEVRPAVTACSAASGAATVTIANRSSQIAFFIRARLTRGPGGADVLPITWTDDYVTLMPGERQTLSAAYDVADLRGANPEVAVAGWNVPSMTFANLAPCQ